MVYLKIIHPCTLDRSASGAKMVQEGIKKFKGEHVPLTSRAYVCKPFFPKPNIPKPNCIEACN